MYYMGIMASVYTTNEVCESGEVKNEFHFIFKCTLYNNSRATFLQNIGNIIPNITEWNEVSQIKTFISKNCECFFAQLILDMFQKRHCSLLFKSCNLTTKSSADKTKWTRS